MLKFQNQPKPVGRYLGLSKRLLDSPKLFLLGDHLHYQEMFCRLRRMWPTSLSICLFNWVSKTYQRYCSGDSKMTPPHFISSLSARYRTKHFICLIWLRFVSPIIQAGKLELMESKLMSEALALVSSWDSNLTHSPAEPVPQCLSWALSPWMHSWPVLGEWHEPQIRKSTWDSCAWQLVNAF